MSEIVTGPYPALQIQQQQPYDLLGNFARALQVRDLLQNAPLQHQLLQNQVQQSQTQNEMAQRNLAASKALQAASANAMSTDQSGKPSFDPDKFQQGIAGTAAFTPETIENLTKMQQARVALQTSQVDLESKVADIKGYAASAIKAANYDPAVAHSLLDGLNIQGPQAQQFRAVVDNPQMLKQWVDTTIAQSPKQQEMQNQKDVAGIRANTPDMQALHTFEQTTGGNALDYQQHKLDAEAQKQISVETNPQVMQAKVRTAAAEGAARAQVEAQIARGSNAALSQVPPHLIGPATAAATKAGTDYVQAQSVSQRLQEMMDAARNGNVVSYQLIPQEGALQVTTSQGVHRINMAEIQNYGGGSLWQQLQGHLGKALSGKSIPSSVLNDMQQMQAIQQRGSQAKYENDLKQINQNYGANFQPIQYTSTAASAPQSYKLTATGPGNHKIGSNDNGQTWFDVQTGKKVQ